MCPWTRLRLLVTVLTVCLLSATASHAGVVGGSLYSWGWNWHGQLGDGTVDEEGNATPRLVPGFESGVTAIWAAKYYSLVVKHGALYLWGDNEYGQLGNGTYGEIEEGVRNLNPVPTQMPGFTSGVTAVAGGSGHTLVVMNGAVYAWGTNHFGQLGHMLDLNEDYIYPIPTPVPVLTSGVTAVAVGGDTSLAIQNGALYAWGFNGFSQLGNGTKYECDPHDVPTLVKGFDSGVTAIAAGVGHCMMIQNGALYTWGYNLVGQLGYEDCLGDVNPTPTQVPGFDSGVTAIAAGQFMSLVVKDGLVYACGENRNGLLGQGAALPEWYSWELLQVGDGILENIIAVAVGDGTCFALGADGKLWAWGDGGLGQLGTGELGDYYTMPYLVGEGYTAISITGNHVLAVGAPVPEPASMALLATGVLGVLVRRRRR